MLSIAALMIIIAAVIGSGAMVATFGWLLHRLKLVEMQGSGARELKAVSEQLTALQDDLDQANRSIGRLTERMDFTERLLAKGPDEEEPEKT